MADSAGQDSGKAGERSHREDRDQSGRRRQQQRKEQKEQKWTRPQSPYKQQGPTGSWVDPYTKRRSSSRAFNRVSQEEMDLIVERLRQPTVSSTGAKEQRDRESARARQRRKSDRKTDEEREAITQSLFSRKTRAWEAKREKNPNTRVHFSTDFTII